MPENFDRPSEPLTRTSSLACLARRFASDTSGATAIEYALIATLIAVSLIMGAQTLGNSINGLFAGTSDELTNSL